MRISVICCLMLIPTVASACNCIVSRSACQEVASSNLVFIGTVESIQPAILNVWQPGSGKSNDWRNDPDIIALKQSHSASGLDRLKSRYLRLFFDLPANEKLRIQAAGTQRQLQEAMDWIVSQGTVVQFKVKSLIRQADDDDAGPGSSAQKNNNKKNASTSVSVWNEFGSCGIPFQKDETYVVYATDDEETDRMSTNVCHRTARISDAGEDLTYLYFKQANDADAARLEGFVTSDVTQLQHDRFHYRDKTASPVRDVVVELDSTNTVRYSESDEGGRFVFDGLQAGDYDVSVFDARDFPRQREELAGPKHVHVAKGGCAVATLLVLSTREER